MKTATRSRYIPDNTTEIIEKPFCTIYLYDHANNEPCAIAYEGNKTKALFHTRYRSADSRTESVTRWIKLMQESYDLKAKHKEDAKTFINPLQVDDIIYCMWGYEQTNVDFYQIIKKTDKSIYIKQIKQHTIENGFMSGNTTPIKDSFANDEVLIKRVKPGHMGHDFYIDFPYGCGSLYDGEPVRCSWYA